MGWADAPRRSPTNTAKSLRPHCGALVSLRGQQSCDLRPTVSNLMDDESLEGGLDGTRGHRVDICVGDIGIAFSDSSPQSVLAFGNRHKPFGFALVKRMAWIKIIARPSALMPNRSL